MEKKPINAVRLAAIYYCLYWFATLTFTFAMLFTIPLIQEDIALGMYASLIEISAALMVLMEVLELVVEPVPKWSLGICLIGVIGCVLFFESSIIYEVFNKGELYLIGSFCISLAYQLKILSIVIQQGRDISAIVRQERYKFVRLGCMAAGQLLFLGGSVVLQIGDDQNWLAFSFNMISGILIGGSAFLLFKKPKHIGYAMFEQEMEIPTII